jgi:hypothetical protein
MLADIFDPAAPKDPLLRAADERGGAASMPDRHRSRQMLRDGPAGPDRRAGHRARLARLPKMPGHKDRGADAPADAARLKCTRRRRLTHQIAE